MNSPFEKVFVKEEPAEYEIEVKEELPCSYSINASEIKDDEIVEEEHSLAADVNPSFTKEDSKVNQKCITKNEEFLFVNCDNSEAGDQFKLKSNIAEHDPLKVYTCSTCLLSFLKRSKIKKHLKMHTDKCNVSRSTCSFPPKRQFKTYTGEKRFKCIICLAAFSQSGGLKAHLRTHTGEKPFKCNICPSAFAQSGGLRRHLKSHTGVKPFQCNICFSTFTQSGNLKTHLKTHTGEKPFKCDICFSAFTQSGSLKTHLKTHTGEKPFKCDICFTAFTHSGRLKTHLQTHTGEKPFKCGICLSSFTRSDNLKVHLRIHMGK